ncbi:MULTISPECIES: hypothetical protein [Devosia]|uniref:Uncharacterized protein n=1 Tax=Devosia salina TaxID=2860336 RepID=A0ABX8WD17_9HYPH|nr:MULTISPECIES: hypothetical protein [Devosia]QYO76572.1 hypothetical protein K1X15_18595 [Devosia salina]
MNTVNTTDACCSSCATASNDAALAIACTLDAHDFKERAASIRDLASRHLLSSNRQPLALRLTYAAEALGEVEALVAKESDCCAFLDFDIRAGEQIELIITAPENAALAADEFFAHFAPELAKVAV